MGGGTTSQNTTTTQQLTPEQQALVSAAVPNYQQFASSTPTMPTGSQAVAGFTPSQVAGQQMTLGATGQMQPVLNTAAGTNQYLSSGAFLDPGSNPYVTNAVNAATQPIYQNLAETTQPQQQATGAAGSGVNFGGSREGIAEAQNTRNANITAGNVAAGIENTALGQGLQATGQAISQAPTTAASLAIPGATTEAVGTEQQQQQQTQLNADNAAAWFQQMLPLLKAQELTQGAAGLPGGSTTAVGQGTTNPSLFSEIAGGASAAGGLMGGLGSLATSAGGLAPLLAMI